MEPSCFGSATQLSPSAGFSPRPILTCQLLFGHSWFAVGTKAEPSHDPVDLHRTSPTSIETSHLNPFHRLYRMSDADAQAAAAAAMAAAVRRFNIELWALYASGVVITALRTYSRISTVGFRRLWADDYLIWLAIVSISSKMPNSSRFHLLMLLSQLIYTTQSTLAYFAVNYAQGLANNSMTDEQRAALSPDSPEYHFRRVHSNSNPMYNSNSHLELLAPKSKLWAGPATRS